MALLIPEPNSIITLNSHRNLPFKPRGRSLGAFILETKTMPHDIVYILKPDIKPEELRYSLRSIEKNFPHRKVFFVCGQPEGFEPDGRIKHKQVGASKWDLIKSSMWEVIRCEEVSDDFFLFNDDFFVMQPFEGDFVNYVSGTLEEYVQHLRKAVHKWLNPYGRTIYKAEQELKQLGATTMNFDVHLPMLFNKKLAAETINLCSSPQMRSVYGNLSKCPYIIRQDVKVYSMEEVPDDSCDFLSTNDDTFKNGKVGEYIREKFPTPSRWEGGASGG